MPQIDVFEPAMCCPTGVCGVSVDPALVRFNADLQALARAGVTVARHSLSHDPAAFAAAPEVLRTMQDGVDRLPIVTVDGRVVSSGLYPSNDELLALLGAAAPETPVTAAAPSDKPKVRLGDCGCAPGQCG